MIGQMKDLMRMQQEAKKIQKKLENIHIEADEEGVVVTISANMNIIAVEISDDAWAKGKRFVEEAIKKATTKGMKKAQEVASQNMKELMSGLGLPSELPNAA